MRPVRTVDRCEAAQISREIADIRVRHRREGGIGERMVVVRPAVAFAYAQLAPQVGLGPFAQAAGRMRGDIGTVKPAERRVEYAPSRIRRAACGRLGMASRAAGD